MLISPPRRFQIVSMNVIANQNVGGGVTNRHTVLDNRFAFSNCGDCDLVSQWNFFHCSDGKRRIVFHTPSLELFALGDVFDGDTDLIFFSINDETNHSSVLPRAFSRTTESYRLFCPRAPENCSES